MHKATIVLQVWNLLQMTNYQTSPLVVYHNVYYFEGLFIISVWNTQK